LATPFPGGAGFVTSLCHDLPNLRTGVGCFPVFNDLQPMRQHPAKNLARRTMCCTRKPRLSTIVQHYSPRRRGNRAGTTVCNAILRLGASTVLPFFTSREG
jgi:hypothetical protein